MTEQQERLTLEILARLEPYFAADDIRPCRFCGFFVNVDMLRGKATEHDKDCVVMLIRQLKHTM
jgi:hypothetical protein